MFINTCCNVISFWENTHQVTDADKSVKQMSPPCPSFPPSQPALAYPGTTFQPWQWRHFSGSCQGRDGLAPRGPAVYQELYCRLCTPALIWSSHDAVSSVLPSALWVQKLWPTAIMNPVWHSSRSQGTGQHPSEHPSLKGVLITFQSHWLRGRVEGTCSAILPQHSGDRTWWKKEFPTASAPGKRG